MDIHQQSSIWLTYLEKHCFSLYSVRRFMRAFKVTADMHDSTVITFAMVLERFILKSFSGYSWLRVCTSLFSNIVDTDSTDDVESLMAYILNSYDELLDAVVSNDVKLVQAKLKPIPMFLKRAHVDAEMTLTSSLSRSSASSSLLYMTDESGWTLLHHCAHHNCVDVLKELVSTYGFSLAAAAAAPGDAAAGSGSVRYSVDCAGQSVLHVAMRAMQRDMIVCLLDHYGMRSVQHTLLDDRGFSPITALLSTIALNNCPPKAAVGGGNSRRNWGSCMTAVQLHEIIACLLPDAASIAFSSQYQVRHTNKCSIWARAARPSRSASSAGRGQEEDGDVYTASLDRFASFKEWKRIRSLRGQPPLHTRITEEGDAGQRSGSADDSDSAAAEEEAASESMFELAAKHCKDFSTVKLILDVAWADYLLQLQLLRSLQAPDAEGGATQREELRDEARRLDEMTQQVCGVACDLIRANKFKALCYLCDRFAVLFGTRPADLEESATGAGAEGADSPCPPAGYLPQTIFAPEQQAEFVAACICLAIKQHRSIRIISYLFRKLQPHLKRHGAGPQSRVLPILQHAVLSEDSLVLGLVTEELQDSLIRYSCQASSCCGGDEVAAVGELSEFEALATWRRGLVDALLFNLGEAWNGRADAVNRDFFSRFSPIGLACLARDTTTLKLLLNKVAALLRADDCRPAVLEMVGSLSVPAGRVFTSDLLHGRLGPGDHAPQPTEQRQFCVNPLLCCVMVGALDCARVLRDVMSTSEFLRLIGLGAGDIDAACPCPADAVLWRLQAQSRCAQDAHGHGHFRVPPAPSVDMMSDSAHRVSAFARALSDPSGMLEASYFCPPDILLQLYEMFSDAFEEGRGSLLPSAYLPLPTAPLTQDVSLLLDRLERCNGDANVAIYEVFTACANVLSARRDAETADEAKTQEEIQPGVVHGLCGEMLSTALPLITRMHQDSCTRGQMLKKILTSEQFHVSIRKLKRISSSNPEFGPHSKWSKLVELMSKLLAPHGLKSKQNTPAAAGGGPLGGVEGLSPLLAAAAGGNGPISPVKQLLKLYGNENKIVENIDVMLLPVSHNGHVLFALKTLQEELLPLYHAIAHNALTDLHEVLSNPRGVSTGDSESVFDRGASPPYQYALRALSAWVMNTMHELCDHYNVAPGGRVSVVYAQMRALSDQFNAALRVAVDRHSGLDDVEGAQGEEHLAEFQRRCKVLLARAHLQLFEARKLRKLCGYSASSDRPNAGTARRTPRNGIAPMPEMCRRALAVFLPSSSAAVEAELAALNPLYFLVGTFVHRNFSTVSATVQSAPAAIPYDAAITATAPATPPAQHQYHRLFESVLPVLRPRPATRSLPLLAAAAEAAGGVPHTRAMESILCNLAAKGAFDELLALPQGYSMLHARCPQSRGHQLFLTACLQRQYAFAGALLSRRLVLERLVVERNFDGAPPGDTLELQSVAHPTIPLDRCGVLVALKKDERVGASAHGHAQSPSGGTLQLNSTGPRYSHVMRDKNCSSGSLVRDSVVRFRKALAQAGSLADCEACTEQLDADQNYVLVTPLLCAVVDGNLEFVKQYCEHCPSLSVDASAVLLADSLNHHDIVMYLVTSAKCFTHEHQYEPHQRYSSHHWWMWGLDKPDRSDHCKRRHIRNVNLDRGFVNFSRSAAMDRTRGMTAFSRTVLLPLLFQTLCAAEDECFVLSTERLQPEFALDIGLRLQACVDKFAAQRVRRAEGRVVVDTHQGLEVESGPAWPAIAWDGQGVFHGLYLNMPVAGGDERLRESEATVPLLQRGALRGTDNALVSVSLQQFRGDVGLVFDALPCPLQPVLSPLTTALRALSGLTDSSIYYMFWKKFVAQCIRRSWGLPDAAARLDGSKPHLGLALDQHGRSALCVAAEQAVACPTGTDAWRSRRARRLLGDSRIGGSLEWVQQLVGDLVGSSQKLPQESITARPGGLDLHAGSQPHVLALPEMICAHTCGLVSGTDKELLRARRRQLELQFLHPALCSMRLAQVQLDQYRRSALALTKRQCALTVPGRSAAPATDAISSLLSAQTIENMHLHRVLLEHLDNCQNTWTSFVEAAPHRSGSGSVHSADGSGFAHLQALIKHCQDPAIVGLHGDGHILDSLFRLKKVLIILGIPYSRLLTPAHAGLAAPNDSAGGDARQSELAAEAQLRSGMGGGSCWVLDKEIETFKYLSPSRLREIIPWAVVEELKEVLQGWIASRVAVPQADLRAGATRLNKSELASRASRLSTASLSKVLVGRLLHHHQSAASAPMTLQMVEKLTTLDVNLAHAAAGADKLCAGALGLSESSFPIMAHRGVEMLLPSKQGRTRLSSASMKENVNSSGRLGGNSQLQAAIAAKMSYYPNLPSAQLQIYSLPSQLQLETLNSYKNIGKSAQPIEMGVSASTHQYTKKYSAFLASWSGNGAGDRFRRSGFASSTPVSKQQLSSEFQLEVLQALNCSYMLLEFVRSLYMARVLASCSTEWEVQRGPASGEQARVHPHPLDMLYAGLERSSRYVASVNATVRSLTDVSTAADASVQFVNKLKVYDCQNRGVASRISSQQTIDSISASDWKEFCTSITITKLVAPAFHRFRLVLLDMLSLVCLSQEQYGICTALCGSIRRSQLFHGAAVVSPPADEDAAWTDELFRLLCSLRILDLMPSDVNAEDASSCSVQHNLNEIRRLMRGGATGGSQLAEPFASWTMCNNLVASSGPTVSSASVEQLLRAAGRSWAQARTRDDVEQLQRVLMSDMQMQTETQTQTQTQGEKRTGEALANSSQALAQARAGVLFSLSRELRAGYAVMEKVMRFLQRAVCLAEVGGDVYKTDAQHWLGRRFANPLLPLIMSEPDQLDGERTALCRDLIAAHSTAGVKKTHSASHSHCLVSLGGAAGSNGHDPIVLAALLGRDSILQLLLSEATYGYAAHGSTTPPDGSALDVLLWHVLWDVPAPCSSTGCPHCFATADKAVTPVVPVPYNACRRAPFENCVSQLLRYGFACRRPAGAVHHCLDIAMVKRLPAATLLQIARKELELERAQRRKPLAHSTSRVVSTPVFPLNALQLVSMHCGDNTDSELFDAVLESAVLRAGGATPPSCGTIIASGDIDLHVQFLRSQVPNTPVPADALSVGGAPRVAPLVAPRVTVSSGGGDGSCAELAEEYVRYHLAACIARLADGGSAENRHRCCPLRARLCEEASREISPAHFAHLAPGGGRSGAADMMSAELEVFSPLVCALALQSRSPVAEGGASTIGIKLLQQYFSETTAGTEAADSESDDVVLMQKLLQYSSFYDRRDELMFVLDKFCYVKGACSSPASSPLSVSSVAASLNYYFEPLHRNCNLVEIAVYSNAYCCVRCLLPVTENEQPPSATEVGGNALSLDWRDLLVTALLNYPHSAPGYSHSSGGGNAAHRHAYPHTTERRVVFEYLLHFINRALPHGADLVRQYLDTPLTVSLGPGASNSAARTAPGAYRYQQHSRGRRLRPLSGSMAPSGILSGETMLHVAARVGSLQLLQLLLSYGASAEAPFLCAREGEDGPRTTRYSILDHCIFFGRRELTRYLGRGGELALLSVNIGQVTAQSSYFPVHSHAVRAIIRTFREYYLRKKVKAMSRRGNSVLSYE